MIKNPEYTMFNSLKLTEPSCVQL